MDDSLFPGESRTLITTDGKLKVTVSYSEDGQLSIIPEFLTEDTLEVLEEQEPLTQDEEDQLHFLISKNTAKLDEEVARQKMLESQPKPDWRAKQCGPSPQWQAFKRDKLGLEEESNPA